MRAYVPAPVLPKAFLLRERQAGKATLQDLGQSCRPGKERCINTVLQSTISRTLSKREGEIGVMCLCFHVAWLVMSHHHLIENLFLTALSLLEQA